MLPISKYIADLLLRQDNVIVPEFGGFVARRIPARLSDGGDRILPPYKQLLFHSNLNLSDGVLEQYIAYNGKVSFAEAKNTLSKTVESWHVLLKNGERIELDNIGFLFKDAEQKIRFEQDRSFNLLLQSYGLGEIVFEKKKEEQAPVSTVVEEVPQAIPVIELNASEAISAVEEDSELEEKVVLLQEAVSEPNKTRPIWLKIAAAAVILPFTFYSFWVPMTTDVLETKKIAFADFNPFHKVATAKYQNLALQFEQSDSDVSIDLDQIISSLPEDASFFNFNYDDELILPVRFEKKSVEQSRVEIAVVDKTTSSESVNSQISASSKQGIHLISGCFGQKENAENHIASLQAMGFDAYLVDIQGGLHRVAALGVSNENDLAAASARLKEKDIAFWTLKK